MPSIHRRGETWYVDFRQGGRRRRMAVGPSKAQAEEARRKIALDLVAKRDGLSTGRMEADERTVSAAVGEWLDLRRERPQTVRDRACLETHVLSVLGATRLSDVGPNDLDRLYASLLDRLAPKSVKNVRGLLSKFWNDSVRRGWTEANPVKRSEQVRVKRDSADNILSAEEARKLIRSSPPAVRALYAAALYLGARQGELLALRWTDLDFDGKLVSIARSLWGPTKSGKPRHVPMHPELKPMLEEWRVLCPRSGEGLVFPTPDGRRRATSKVWQTFQDDLKRAGCHKIKFHDLRHTAASFLVMAGVPIRTVQEVMGHSTVAMTERYSHLAPGHAAAEIARFRLNDPQPRTTAPEDRDDWRKRAAGAETVRMGTDWTHEAGGAKGENREAVGAATNYRGEGLVRVEGLEPPRP